MHIFLYYLHRVNSVKNLGQISTALGQERTRNELLPYILGNLTSQTYIIEF